MTMLKTTFAVVAVLLAVCMSEPMAAQSDLATIVGRVKDPSAAVIPHAVVQVTNLGTNEVKETVTDGTGYYRVGNLPIGEYKVTFAKTGFDSLERRGITLLISQVAEVDAVLKVGASTDTVEVTASPILQTEDAVLSTNLNNDAVTELPLDVSGGRSLTTFMFNYVPGVEGNDSASHINGSMAWTKEVLIDGTSAVSQLGGYISESQPPYEAVQEFEVDTAGISADAGRSGGGVFKYELKSGQNKIHGSAFGFLHNHDLDAISASNHLAAITDPANAAAYLKISDSLSDWGGSFGGAIKKDKLFYYLAFERYMQSNFTLAQPSRTVPTNAMMGLDANGNTLAYADLSPMLTLSAALAKDACGNTVYQGSIYDPATNLACVFPGNQIPTSRISKVSSQILQLYHKYYSPETSSSANNAGTASGVPHNHITQESIKMDYLLGSNQHLAGSFYWDYYPRILADQGGVWSPTAPDGGPMANSYYHNTTAPGARLSDAITITPNLINTVHATFNRFRNPSIAISQSGGWDQKLLGYNGAGNFPLIYFDSGEYTNAANYQNGWNFSSLGSQFNDYYAANTFIYSDETVWSHGRQNIKFGVEFRAMQFNYKTDNGTFTGGYPIIFDPSTTAGYGYQQTGNAFAAFLLGDVYNAESNNPDNEYGRRKAFSWYFDDSIRVNQKLTVDLSLRWDFNTRFKEKFGHWSSFELNDTNPITGLKGAYEYLTNGSESFERRQDPYNYAPHLGVAYALTEKTIVRGNFGVFFTPLNMNQYGGVPYQQQGNVGFHNITQEGHFNWDNGYSPNLTPSSGYNAAYQGADMISIDPRSLTPGNTWQYNVGVQRQLGKVTKVDVNWIQSRSTHLQSGFFETNQPHFTDYQNWVVGGTTVNGGVGDPNSYYSAACGVLSWWCITPYPQAATNYSSMFSVSAPLGNGDYKSLQFSVTRRARGLSLMGSYSWSQTHGDVDSDFQEIYGTGSLQNIYDLKDEARSIADFDVTHIVKGYVTYNLPVGRGQRFLGNTKAWVDDIVGGWSLAGDYHYSTGTPITVRSQNSYPGFSSVYINVVAGCSLTNSGQRKLYGQFLNPACFQNPDPGLGSYAGTPRVPQLGNAPAFFSNLRNPGLAVEDMGLHKSIGFGEQHTYNLTLRAEFFNVFNRHALGGPDTNLSDTAPLQHFGQIIGYGGPGGRVGQIGARFAF